MGKMDNLQRLGGRRYGEWYVHDVACGYDNDGAQPNIRWLCECSCGTLAWVRADKLKSGRSTRCRKCHDAEMTSHGGAGTRLYKIWVDMKHRCCNENSKRYGDYGKRGIKICDQWLNSYENFRSWALANGYDDSLTIDRKNVNGDYTQENCRWVTYREQNRNRRDNRSVTYGGKVYGSIAELAEALGMKYKTLYTRIASGWPPERWAEPVRSAS